MSKYEWLTYIKDGLIAVIKISSSKKKEHNLKSLSVELDRVCEDIGIDSRIRDALIQGADREAVTLVDDLVMVTMSVMGLN